MNESSFTIYQETYPALQKYTYLNTASCGLLSTETQQVIQKTTQEFAQAGSVARDYWFDELGPTRSLAANLLGATQQEIALTTNFTTSIYHVAQLFQNHRRVLVVADDYPSLVLPWHLLGYEVFAVSALPDGRIPLEVIEENIRRHNIEVLAVSHVQYSSGFRLPLASLSNICRSNGTKLVVDATQTLGMIPIDLSETPVDMLIASGYKWLNAGLGNGLVYIRQGLHSELNPRILGFGAVGSDFSPHKIGTIPFTPSTLEVGHSNFFSLLGLQQALKEVLAFGVCSIFEKGRQLRQILIEELPTNVKLISNYGNDHSSNIVVVKAPDGAENQLKSRSIITSTRPLGLRISPHFYNSEQDIQKLHAALAGLR